MGRVSNKLLVALNTITFLISIPILVCGIWLERQHHTDCDRFLDKPLIVIGVFILLVSVMGFVGSCFKVTWLIWVYVVVTFVLVVLLFCFTVFAFVVTNKGAGRHYSEWLQNRVNTHWDKFRSCVKESFACQSLNVIAPFINKFDMQNLSPLQSGCCKPPSDCNFNYQSPTKWTATPNSSLDNPDCNTWSNNQNILCYDCQSCKAGLVKEIKRNWKVVAIVNVSFLVFLVIVLAVGCCAIEKRDDNKYRHTIRTVTLGS